MPVLENLEKEHAGDARVAEALAYAFWGAGEMPKAQKYFDTAAAAPAPSAKLLYDAARFQMYGGRMDERGVGWLRRALEQEPEWADARIQLMEHMVAGQQYTECRNEAKLIKRVDPKVASRLFRILAHAEAMTGAEESSARTIEKALQYASDFRDRENAARLKDHIQQLLEARKQGRAIGPEGRLAMDHFLRPLDSTERADLETERPRLVRRSGDDVRTIEVEKGDAVEAIEGTLTNVDCLGVKARLHIKSAEREIALMIHDPESVVIRSEAAAELQCGPQARRIRADYLVKDDAATKTQGVLKILEYPR